MGQHENVIAAATISAAFGVQNGRAKHRAWTQGRSCHGWDELDTYQRVIGLMKQTGRVREAGHVLYVVEG